MSQIKLLLDIVSDLKHLSDSLEEYAKAVVQNEKLSLNDFEQIYPPVEDENTAIDAVPEKETEPLKAVTLTEVRAVLAGKSREGFTEEVKQLLMKHGAEKLSGIAKSEYAALLKEAENLGS